MFLWDSRLEFILNKDIVRELHKSNKKKIVTFFFFFQLASNPIDTAKMAIKYDQKGKLPIISRSDKKE